MIVLTFPKLEVGYSPISFVSANGSGTGTGFTMTGSAAGDLILGITTNGNQTIPVSVPSGTTQIGAGITSVEASGEVSILCYAKIAAGTNEAVGAAGGVSRHAAVALRGCDPDILSGMPGSGTSSAGKFAYGATTGANWVIPPVTPTRAAVVVSLGRRSGAADTAWPDMGRLRLQNAASAPAQIYWTGEAGAIEALGDIGVEVGSFPGFSYAITSTVGRAAMSFVVYPASL